MEWISVEYQLPEQCKDVIIYCSIGVCIGSFVSDRWIRDSGRHLRKVTHWMYLPNIPKKEW